MVLPGSRYRSDGDRHRDRRAPDRLGRRLGARRGADRAGGSVHRSRQAPTLVQNMEGIKTNGYTIISSGRTFNRENWNDAIRLVKRAAM